jgi:hypothetical protein
LIAAKFPQKPPGGFSNLSADLLTFCQLKLTQFIAENRPTPGKIKHFYLYLPNF